MSEISFQQFRELEEKVLKLERKIKSWEPRKQTWVKSAVIIELTGWDRHGMRTAREHGYVKFKNKKQTGFWYLIQSIHPFFLKKKEEPVT
jgi:hypothetical protein